MASSTDILTLAVTPSAPSVEFGVPNDVEGVARVAVEDDGRGR